MAKTMITPIRYKNVDALLMESDAIALTIIPESGAKIQSIFDKARQKEILYQSDRKEFRKAEYGSRFVNGDVSGFDEVFPSIDECFYPTWPWAGAQIPDHGEVWALPWDFQVTDDEIHLSVHGVRFPYRIEKSVEFLRANCVRLSYRVTNLSDFDFDSIWCPHPFFVCDEGTRVVLPPSVKQIVSTCSLENKLGKFGSLHSWPVTMTESGEEYDISDVLHPSYDGKCEKFYAVNKPPEGWCALHNAYTGETIGLSYPAELLPFLGVWEGILNGQYITALEPVTGALDRLDVAKLAGKAGIIKSRSSVNWYLNLTLDTVDIVQTIDRDGCIK